MFKDLDPLLNNQLRLAIMNILLNVEEANFSVIQQKANASAGNLSIQLNKLKNAGYVEVKKHFRNNYPQTTCKISSKGITAFNNYEEALQSYFKPKEPY
jgi:DNA-binding transcriptional ArsR family regulator